MHGSRSLEMFQQSLVENSSQEESPVSKTEVQAGDIPENSERNERVPEEDSHIEKESGTKYIISSVNWCNRASPYAQFQIQFQFEFRRQNVLACRQTS